MSDRSEDKKEPSCDGSFLSDQRFIHSHGLAFRGTFAAFISALLTMLVLKLSAACCAFPANRGAQLAHLFCVLCIHGHQAGCFLAETCTFQHHANMIRSLGHIRLLQAKDRAFMARLKAAKAGVDTFLIIVKGSSHNTHRQTSPFGIIDADSVHV